MITKQTKGETGALHMRQRSSLKVRTDTLLFYPVCCWPGEGCSAVDKTIRGVLRTGGEWRRHYSQPPMHRRHAVALHYKYQPEKERPDKRNLFRSSLWDEQLIPACMSPLQRLSAHFNGCTLSALSKQGRPEGEASHTKQKKKSNLSSCQSARSIRHPRPAPPAGEQQSRNSIKWKLQGWLTEMICFNVGLGSTRWGVRTEWQKAVAITTSRKERWTSRFQQTFFCHVTDINLSPEDRLLSCYPLTRRCLEAAVFC